MGWHDYKNKPGRYYRGRKSNGEYYTAHDDGKGCYDAIGYSSSNNYGSYNNKSDDESEKEQILATILDDMVKCHADTFVMGGTRYKEIILDDFYISKYPVTQIQYKAVMGNNPSHYKGPRNPVENVSWYDAKAFCKKLNELTASIRPNGYIFDIPDEEQWEYACKSGTDTSFNNGKNITSAEDCCSSLNEVGWYRGNSGGHTHTVGQKKANAWGIYDMHGNVWEWCNTGIDYKYVIKGGSWNNFPIYCCSTALQSDVPEYKSIYLGFRIALVKKTLEEIKPKHIDKQEVGNEKALVSVADENKNRKIVNICLLIIFVIIIVGLILNSIIEENQKKAARIIDAAKQEAVTKYKKVKGIEQKHILPVILTEMAEKIIKEMVKCPAGSFEMGSPSGELGRYDGEKQHHVTISKSFYIAKYPVTQAQYKAVMGNNPSHFKGDNNPVECVSWFRAKEFCDKLNEVTGSTRPAGYKFDLPTEAQWEYACRAGTTTSLNSGKNITSKNGRCSNLDEVGWYHGNSEMNTHPVGLKKPNAWGIYDMHGNVGEWCSDRYGEYPSGISTDPEGPVNGFFRVYRGGGWGSDPRDCRSAYRHDFGTHDFGRDYLGFRVALVPSSK